MLKTNYRFWKVLLPFIMVFMVGCGLFQLPLQTSQTIQIPVTGGGSNQLASIKSTPSLPNFAPTNVPSPVVTALPTATSVPTISPTPYIVPTLTNAPIIPSTPVPAASVSACDIASFVQDVTIPDGTLINAGDTFQKIWRLQNTGSCTWNTNYQVVFDRGDLLSAPAIVNMPASVAPGQTVDIPITMDAPTTNGTYSGYWKILDPIGTAFGVGTSGNTDFFVNINVGTSSSFAVSHVVMNVDNSSVTTYCPTGYPFTVYAQIETTLPGNVTYNWVFSNGATTNPQTITIDDSLTQTVSTTFNPNATGTYWAQIWNETPNHQYFSQVSFSLTCLQTPTDTPTLTSTPTLTTTTTQTPIPTLTPTSTQTSVPTSTPTLTSLPTLSPTPTQTQTSTSAPTQSPTPTQTQTPTSLPTHTQTPTPTQTPLPTLPPTSTHTLVPTATQTSLPTMTPTPTNTPTATSAPTQTYTSTPK